MSTLRAPTSLVRPLGVLVSLCAALALGACETEEAKPADTKKEDPGPQIKVQLPPTPDFDEGKVEEKYGDGSLSILSLIHI